MSDTITEARIEIVPGSNELHLIFLVNTGGAFGRRDYWRMNAQEAEQLADKLSTAALLALQRPEVERA
jgi:hypothetical protein